jgi:HIRAN domain/HipA-like C-terminal domain
LEKESIKSDDLRNGTRATIAELTKSKDLYSLGLVSNINSKEFYMKFPIIDVNDWLIDEYREAGKGNREKIWLNNTKKQQIAMFKLPRENRGEHWAEKLAAEIAKIIKFPCAEVDLAMRNGSFGSLSYLFVREDEGFSHYDCGDFFSYDYDFEKNSGYNFQLINEVLISQNIEVRDFLFVIFFDALIANGDRHQDNFGLTRHERSHKMVISPLYDNSASLGRDLSEAKLDNYISDDEALLRYIYKGKSKIGWKSIRQSPHFSLTREMCKMYPNESKLLINQIKNLDDNILDKLLKKFPTSILTEKQKNFLFKFIKFRRDIIIKIGDYMNSNSNKLKLIWKDPVSRQRFVVALLEYDSEQSIYRFKYLKDELDEAINHGFKNFPNFPDLTKIYEVENNLFNSIKTRLPLPKRPDYATILNRFNLTPSNSDMEILEATRGRSATDTFEFIQAIDISMNNNFRITFDLAGARYSDYSDIREQLKVGDLVSLEPSLDNPYDKNAVKVMYEKEKRLGYVPKYYSLDFRNLLNSNMDFEAYISSLDITNTNQDEWVKITIDVSKKVEN